MSHILVVGSVGYDSIQTPRGKVENVLGGSANYFSIAASLYTKVRVVGVVGSDYKDADLHLLKKRSVDTEGLKIETGETFRWSGSYMKDLNEAETLKTELNVFKNFNPDIPKTYRDSEIVFLANIDPVLQMRVLDQVQNPQLVGLDTMNFWIDSKKSELLEVLKRIDIFMLNEKEALKLTGVDNIVEAVHLLAGMGPRTIVVKRGEYGFFMFMNEQFFVMPAYPVREVVDPTGAGDTFAGGFYGYLSQNLSKVHSWHSLQSACVHGCVLASYSVEDFSIRRLDKVRMGDVQDRLKSYLQITTLGHH